MKVVIIYTSQHHKNTFKLLSAIKNKYDVLLVEASNLKNFNFNDYDIIGLASGIYKSKFSNDITNYMNSIEKINKKVFIIYTSGSGNKNYANKFVRTIKEKGGEILGIFSTKGYDTFGPFKYIGGIAKGHPTDKEIEDVIKFYETKIIHNEIT